MAKIIAVVGSPGSGKTTISMKLAQEVYCATSSGEVIYLSPSLRVPSLGLLFPNYTPDSLFSIGQMLDKTDINEEDVLNHLVTVKSMKNFGCLGYKTGEYKYTYPALTEDKVKALFGVLSIMTGYIFVDCTEEDDDLITQYALKNADVILMVLSPDLKSMVWLSSYENWLGSNIERAIKVLNINESDLFAPTEDIRNTVKNISFVLPFNKTVRAQLQDGQLYDRVKDKKYRIELSKLIKMII